MLHEQVESTRQGWILMVIKIMPLRSVVHPDIHYIGVQVCEVFTGRLTPKDFGDTKDCKQNAYRQEIILMRAAWMCNDFIHANILLKLVFTL
jgi:hypothetical protein